MFIPKKIQKGPVLASTANTNVFDDDSEEVCEELMFKINLIC